MNLTKKQVIIVGVVITVIVLIIVFGTQKNMGPQKEVTLYFWGVSDTRESFDNVIARFKNVHPKVDVIYQQLDEATYQNDLINALAANRGPDIFMFGNTWLAKHGDKTLPFDKTKISLTNLRKLFPGVVEKDFYDGTDIFALPLYIDTLATLYNKNIFNNLAIAVPPKTWLDLGLLIPKLRKTDSKTNKIQRAAAAIGGSNQSINNASDILNLLMVQEGVEFPQTEGERISFNRKGEEALSFYLQLSNPMSSMYGWDENFSNSLEAFSNNQVAVIFDYAKNLNALNKKNPYLSIGIAPIMQFDPEEPDNFSSYWGLAVSKKSENYSLAQDFIIFLTTNKNNSKEYLETSGHPPALNELIAQYQDDPVLGVFASQALSARSWRRVDSDFVGQVFSDMIKAVLTNRLSISNALEEAENKINSLIKQ